MSDYILQLINAFPALSDAQANDDTKLLPFGLAGTGKLYKVTVAQAKKIFGTFRIKYVATGAEGFNITITELAAKEILMIAREGGVMYEVPTNPDNAEYAWDTTTINVGAEIQAGERFLILYKNG